MRFRIIGLLVSLLCLNQLSAQPDFHDCLADSAFTLTKDTVEYDPSYYRIDYPNGDVPKGRGVCTDVVIRAYRKLGIDLQKEVHEDMKANFGLYPKHWGLSKPDKNIDHRRVPNLMIFFSRHGQVLQKSLSSKDYKPGDIVCWDLGGGILHIGLVSCKLSWDKERYLLIHNIGSGQVADDCLFRYEIIGHYRYKR